MIFTAVKQNSARHILLMAFVLSIPAHAANELVASCSTQLTVATQMVQQSLIKNVTSAKSPSDYLIQMGKEGMAQSEVAALARQRLSQKLSDLEGVSHNLARLPGYSSPVQVFEPRTKKMTQEEFVRKHQLEWANNFPVGKRDMGRWLEVQELIRLMLLSGDTSMQSRVVALAFHYQAFGSLIPYASETGNYALLRKIGEFSLMQTLFHSRDLDLSAFFEITGRDKLPVDEMLFDFYDLLQHPEVLSGENPEQKEELRLQTLYATGDVQSRWRLTSETYFGYLYVMKPDSRPDFLERLDDSLQRFSQYKYEKHHFIRVLAKSGDRRRQIEAAQTFYNLREKIVPGESEGFSYDENLEAALIMSLISGQVDFSLKVINAMIDNPNMGERFYFRELYQPELGYMNPEVLRLVVDGIQRLKQTHQPKSPEKFMRLMNHLESILTHSAKNFIPIASFSGDSKNSELFDSVKNDVKHDVERLMRISRQATMDQRAAWIREANYELQVENRPIVAVDLLIKARDRQALMQLYQKVMSDDPSLFTGPRLAIVCAMAIRAMNEEARAAAPRQLQDQR